jgi:type IV pilus assembly protein PilW
MRKVFHRARGVTLIELMIAMTIGLIIIAGIGYIYLQGREGNRVQDAQSRLQEDVRFVTEIVSREFRNARYMGCAGARDDEPNALIGEAASVRLTGEHPWFQPIDAIPNSSVWLMKDGGTSNRRVTGVIDISWALRGFDDGNGWPNTASLADRIKPNTDVLMFMKLGDESREIQPRDQPVTEFDVVGGALPGIRQDGRLAVLAVHSCSGVEIVKATVRNGGNRFSIANTYNGRPGDEGGETESLAIPLAPGGAQVSRFDPVAYYIVRDDKNKSNLPALFRVGISDMTPASIEAIQTGVWDTNGGELIATGVDNMQLRYLVGVNNSDQYLTATQVNALGNPKEFWPQVRAVEVTLTLISGESNIRSTSETQTLIDGSTVTDKRLRQEVRFVVNFPNI